MSLKPKKNKRKKIDEPVKSLHIIKPMLASLHEGKPFDDKEWLFEMKWDGYRAIAQKKGNRVLLYSRNGLMFSNFPLINKELSKWEDDFILDGELVVLDKEGKPSFEKLQQYKDDPSHPLVYYVFDLLEWNDKDLQERKLKERKAQLQKLLKKTKSETIRFSDHVINKGVAFFEQVSDMNLEGIMAKKIDSRYVQDYRSKEWLKIKNVQTMEAIIAGYTEPEGSRSAFGALILAEDQEGELTYIGHVGTGFNEKSLRDIKKQLDVFRSDNSPLKEKFQSNAPVTWVAPKLVCTVKYSERTKSGSLRHPVFIGLRPDKEVEELIMDKNYVIKKIEGFDVKLTHLEKLYWPENKITKGMMLEYYEKIGPLILPYLKDRPLSLNRMPNGIHTNGFYHKDAGENAPEFVKTEIVESESLAKKIDFILVNNLATLLYVANLGSIEMNPWNSLRNKPDHPTYMVIDIDPSEKNTFEQVIEVAQVAHNILDKANIPSYPKTSGATGLHIYIPMGNKYPYDQAKEFAHIIAIMIHEHLPELTSIERMIKKRGDRIYIDYLQNAKGQTLASAYSIRPVQNACVSTPLTWDEVKKGLRPDQFTIRNMLHRVREKGDLFSPVLGKGIDMKKSIKNLESF